MKREYLEVDNNGLTHFGRNQPYPGKEDDLHRTFVQYLQIQYGDEVNYFHTPNGGNRNAREAVKFRRMGVVPGVPDLIFMHPIKPYHGLCMELKVGGGRLSDHQTRFLTRAQDAGYYVAVCWSLDACIDVLTKYLNKCKT